MSENTNYQNILKESYSSYDLNARKQRLRIGLFIALAFVAAFGILDFFYYRSDFILLITIRFVTEVVLITLFFILRLSSGERIKMLEKIWAIFLFIFIDVLIFFTEGATSSYYAGLNLTVVAMSVLMLWTFKEALFVCFSLVFLYIITIVIHHNITRVDYDSRVLVNNIFFIIGTAIICVIASYVNSKKRFQEFCLNYELEQNNQKLAALDKIKSQFFANVSHELRTPLTLILAPTQDVLQDTGNSISQKVQSSLEVINKNALRLLKLVNDLLDITKLEEGKSDLKLQKLEVNNLVAGLSDSVSHLAKLKGVRIVKNIMTKDLFIAADVDAMEKIILNLLGNAIKFTDKGGEIKVSTSIQENDIVISIADDGIGISSDNLPYIFDRFKQVDSSSTRKYQGTGLGLALVKELTELQKGQVSVESVIDNGTIFKLSFPRLTEKNLDVVGLLSEEEDADILKMTKMARRVMPKIVDEESDQEFSFVNRDAKTVLVAEDEPDMSSYITNLVKGEGYNVIKAKDGKVALELANRFSPDLIILDLMLPEIDGLLICEQLKSDDRTRFIKIIMVTARSDEKSKLTALKNGVDDFVNKPFSSSELKARINNILKSDRLQKDMYQQLRKAMDQLTLAQNRLVRSEKLNIMGRLPEEIMHGVKNPLNYMVTALYSMKLDPTVNSDPELISIIRDVEDGVKRIDDIVSDIRSFADFSEIDRTKFLIKDAVDDAVKFIRYELRNIKVDLDVDNKLYVIASKNHITQVLINLISNAIKAIIASENNVGKITIRCKHEENKAVVTVSDNGIGIRNEDLKVIFNPFFTTKDIGSGIGLGLNISYVIINNHNSELKVISEFGKGSSFYFDLPIW
ncbi:MAG: response regulator [Rickettsiales bacterium]|nr:response regulator [Rickettsiales bacterium]